MISTFSATIRNRTRPHAHVVHELMVGVEGEALLQVEDKHYPIDSRHSILIPAGIPHSYDLAAGGKAAKATFVCFEFGALESQLLGIYKGVSDSQLKEVVTRSAMDESTAAETSLLVEILQASVGAATPHARAKSVHVLGSIVANHMASLNIGDATDRSEKQEKIEKALQWIDRHLPDDLSIDDAAAQMHMSRSTFTRSFKQFTNHSFTEYVSNARLRKASDLLSQSKLPIAEVAWRSGFKNMGHFYSKFQKQYGMTPSQYRKVSI